MTSQTRATLKGYFNTNDQPTEAQFADLIDSGLNLADETNWTLGSGVDEYALVYDHDTARFVLRAPFAGLLATGATVGATSQAQAFTLGVVSPFVAPAADSTAALQLRKADGTTAVVTVDTTNARVGIGTASPASKLSVAGNVRLSSASERYILVGEDSEEGTNTGRFTIQAGAGSASFGGAINLFGHASVTKPGWVTVGIDESAGSGATEGRFTVNSSALGAGTDLVTVLRSGNVGIGTISPATRLDIDAGAMTMAEMTAPTGVANKAMLYTKDTGGGKTALCVKLGDDVEIVLATQA